MAPNPEKVKIRKKRKSRIIPEGTIRARRILEVICPECSEVVRESLEQYRELVGEYVCGNCDTKFKTIWAPDKKDGRGKTINKEVARNKIIGNIGRDGPISAKKLRDITKLNRVATKRILDDLREEGLIKNTPQGWVSIV